MSDSGQVISSAADIYDEFFLPALFSAWAPRVLEAAHLGPGMRVLDVACGTGVLTIEAAKAVSPGGMTVGIDLNPEMLAVARRKDSEIEWRQAAAETLPLDSDDFDAVVSQFGLMFFENKEAAIREMWRVLRPGGRLVVAVWDSLENTPGYAGITALLERLFGEAIAELLKSPYALGDPRLLRNLLATSGVKEAEVSCIAGDAHFPSIRSWMHTDVRGWTLAGKLDEDQFEQLVAEAETELRSFVTASGSVRFDHPALIATARKP
jgi:ubiquinone/menaquinone biosynthesis C-methylase UbiE